MHILGSFGKAKFKLACVYLKMPAVQLVDIPPFNFCCQAADHLNPVAIHDKV